MLCMLLANTSAPASCATLIHSQARRITITTLKLAGRLSPDSLGTPGMAAALSLQCRDCGVQLRSVAEAQSHGEATGE